MTSTEAPLLVPILDDGSDVLLANRCCPFLFEKKFDGHVRSGGRSLPYRCWVGARRRIHTESMDFGLPQVGSSHLYISSLKLEDELVLQRNSSCHLILVQKSVKIPAISPPNITIAEELCLYRFRDMLPSLTHPLGYFLEDEQEAFWYLFKLFAISEICSFLCSVVMNFFKLCSLLVAKHDVVIYKADPGSPLLVCLDLASQCKFHVLLDSNPRPINCLNNRLISGLLVLYMDHDLQRAPQNLPQLDLVHQLDYQANLWLLVFCCLNSCLNIVSSLKMSLFASFLEMPVFASLSEMPLVASFSERLLFVLAYMEMSPFNHHIISSLWYKTSFPTRERSINSVGYQANDVWSISYPVRFISVRRFIYLLQSFFGGEDLLCSFKEEFTHYASYRALAIYTAIRRCLIGRLRAALSWSFSGICEASMVEHLDHLGVEDTLGDYRRSPLFFEDLSWLFRLLALVTRVMLNFSFEDGKSLILIVVTETKYLTQ